MKMSQKSQVLAMLKAGKVTTAEFIQTPPLGAEYRARISELRRDGHRIEARKVRNGMWEYELVDRLSTHTEPQG